MNTINKFSTNTEHVQTGSLDRLRAVCTHCYRGVLHRLAAVKVRVGGEFGREMAGHEQLLRVAINEAEAVAWQTPYPHLFFPVLAEEKAAEAQRWAARQRAIQEHTTPEPPQFQLAA